jgi:SAM-dependent methyltransferase
MTVNKFEVLSKTASPPFPTEWYDFSSETHFWIRWRFEAFRMLLRDNGLLAEPGQRGLDVGCGTGIIQRQLQSGLGWHVDGCDLNSEALTRNWTPDARIMLYNVFDRKVALRETYDYLVIFDVLEHIQEPVPFLEAALHSLKPGGIVFINVPALPSLFSRYDVAAGHFRRYTRSALADELQRAGIEITETRYWGLSLVLIVALRKQLIRWLASDQRVIEIGFRPPHPAISTVFTALMTGELACLSRPPFGSSVLAIGRKPAKSK